MKRFAFLMLLAFAIVGCQIQEDYSSESLPEKMEDVNESDKIPVEEMLSNLDGLLKEIDDVNTRFGGRRVRDIAVLGSSLIPSTRSQDAPPMDSLLYLINFEDYEGFALMAADKRMGSPVYAITESGELLMDEVELLLNADEQTLCDENGVTNGALFAKELILNYAIRDFNEAEPESEEPQTRAKTVISVEEWTDVVQRKIVPTIVKTKWGQGYPFNMNLTARNSLGCAVVALAQTLVAEKRIPDNSLYGTVMCCLDTMETVYHYSNMKGVQSWTIVDRSVAESVIPTLPADTARKYGTYNARVQCGAFAGQLGVMCGIPLDSPSSEAYMTILLHALTSYEPYEGAVLCFGYDHDEVVDIMLENRPVIMSGVRRPNIGHAWVLDGYVQVIQQDVTRTTYSDFTEDVVIDETILKHLLHVNWGWTGQADGYYLSGVFKAGSRETFDGTYDNYDDEQLDERHYNSSFYVVQY